MNIYTNATFNGHYPVGTAAVVVAKDQLEAARELSNELLRIGLPQDVNPSEMIEIKEGVRILCDGDY